MSIVAGRTKVQNLALELLALESEARGATGVILQQVDNIERDDIANDQPLTEALRALERAIELGEGSDRQASLIQAKVQLQIAIGLDLNEMGAAKLRAMIMPFHNKFEALGTETRQVIGDIMDLRRRAA